MNLLLENNLRGGISSLMGDRSIKSDDSKKMLYNGDNNLYGDSMSQMLLYDELLFDVKIKLEDILYTPGDSDIGDFVDIFFDLS